MLRIPAVAVLIAGLSFGFGAVGITACVLNADGFSGGGVPPADVGSADEKDGAAAGDGGTTAATEGGPTDGPTDGAAEGPNLLVNGDFELGCTNWNRQFAEISESTTARSGAGSCQLCRGTNFEAFLNQDVDAVVEVGQEYVAEVWLRTVDDAGKPDVTDLTIIAAANASEGAASTGPPLAADWKRLTAFFKAPVTSKRIALELRIQNGSPCVLVDDATLHRTK